MAMPQRDKYIDEILRTEGLLAYAVEHGDGQEVERLRKELERLTNLGDNDMPNNNFHSQLDC